MSGMHRLATVARRLGWGRNALRRPSDRIEIATVIAAIVLTVAAVPVALSIGSAVYEDNLAVSAAQTDSRHEVTATLLEGTSSTVTLQTVVSTVPAQARWVGPDGRQHTGIVAAPQQAAAGTAVRIWTDANGTVVSAPLSPSQAWGRGALAVVMAMAAVIALLAALVGLARWWLDRIRFAAWDAEWRQIDPWRSRHTS